ncbi:hypothetical protein G6F56_006839 [Rhizopus delemar]|nr:hypothetical protein G6F56_006839 [Rhizopus delemar]
MTRALAKSISQPTEDELTIIDKQYEFINAEFKFNIHDLETLINLLRTRLLAEELYIGALTKVKKVTSIYESEKTSTQDSHLTFQQAVKVYEASVYDLIENRQNVRDTLKKEIEKLVQEKEHEEMTRKTHKAKLSEANLNYMNFRNRDIVKLQKSYTHRCEELKNAQNIYQQQQCVHANEETNDGNKSSRNSSDTTRLSGDYNSPREIDGEQHNKKGMAGLFSQMRTMAVGNHVSPVDQNKQISKFAKMKKDITDADIEYRDGVLILETLRKKQRKAVEETNWQVKNTIKRKAESVKSSLLSIVLTEMECLRVETEKTTASLTAAMKVDSSKDIQIYSIQYQANGYTPPAPIRYESFYFEGKCRGKENFIRKRLVF